MLPPLQPISTSRFYMSGEVTVDPSAAIAPGAILKADPDSQIIIAAGVCIGMGAILHAHEGIIQVETGATLGAGVLVVGKSKIGANACIGSSTTIWNSDITSGQFVPPGSLLGDRTHQMITQPTSAPAIVEPSLNGQPEPATNQKPASPISPPEENHVAPQDAIAQKEPEPTIAQKEPEPKPSPVGISVYGQANLNRLMGTLFRDRNSLKPPNQDD